MKLAVQHGGGRKTPPIPADAFNVNPADREWVNSLCTMQPLATLQQPIHLTGAIESIRNVSYILASGWSPSPFPPFYERAKSKGWRTVEMPCGHDVMLDMPVELTRELIAAAPKTSAAAR